ncbi:MAG: hypothetical protein E6Q88_10195 [Lysobacteraceae bacterium]|nr:MAG: hypothetical protein E6Q88_10195 [Xanthomonadaceae bacterium]
MRLVIQVCIGVSLALVSGLYGPSATAAAFRKLTPEQQKALCRIQSTVNQLKAEQDDKGNVTVSWVRVDPGGLLQYRIPPRSYPVETRIRMDGDPMQGELLPNSWFRALDTPNRPMWRFEKVEPGRHTFAVAQKDECGDWDKKQVAIMVKAHAAEPEDNDEVEITEQEAEDLSPGANFNRYISCMYGVGPKEIAQGAYAVIKRQKKKFFIKFISAPLSPIKHGACLIEATGGLDRPPDPDEDIMNCYPEMGMYSQCPDGWEAFYKSSDGTRALNMMGPGPAPTAEGRDDQARLSCLAVIYNKYIEYGRNLDRAFEDTYLINQGCNKAAPAGSR